MSTENEVSESSNKIENEEVFDSSAYEISSWDELEISGNILRGIYAYGFEKPSPIQQKAIKPIIMGKDIIAQAQSGTGKTATFSIGALSMVMKNIRGFQIKIFLMLFVVVLVVSTICCVGINYQ
jgi:translation initiation factor 4A